MHITSEARLRQEGLLQQQGPLTESPPSRIQHGNGFTSEVLRSHHEKITPGTEGTAATAGNIINIVLYTARQKEPAVAKRASSTKAATDFNTDGDDSDKGFMYATIHTGKKAKATSTGVALRVDTGETETTLDNRLIPGLKATMQEYRDLAKLKAITVGGNHELKGAGTGLFHCAVNHSCGKQQTVHLPSAKNRRQRSANGQIAIRWIGAGISKNKNRENIPGYMF